MEYLEKRAELLKAIAHPIRLCILDCLINQKKCNVTRMMKVLGKPQSTISQHLAKLRMNGIVEGKRKGLEVTYKILDDDVVKIVKLLLKGKNFD
ncbi:metalloregulator ArsR/SmtB family transcription factor [Helicovermis profundi]|uniref:Metalloregulator ArsR/SmtB family transcription factor n=2 Tax=Helicovermis profundi TaxID=3065157 RepID=A0AAU9EDJ4_9FIRM|nr:metalloregulator ArsR/SmtB family transcription factor [Clostridia bacterium S502]